MADPLKRCSRIVLAVKAQFRELSLLIASLEGEGYLAGSGALGGLRESLSHLSILMENLGADGLSAEDLEAWSLRPAERVALLGILDRIKRQRKAAEAASDVAEQCYRLRRKPR